MANKAAQELADMQAELESDMLAEEGASVEVETEQQEAPPPKKGEEQPLEFVAEPEGEEAEPDEAKAKDTEKGKKKDAKAKGKEEKDEEKPEEVEGGKVPHQALHSERERRKAAERELEQFRVSQARLEERVKLISEAWQQGQQQRQPEQQPESDEPNAQEDPIGWIAWRQRKDHEWAQAQEQYRSQQNQTQAQQQRQAEEWNNAMRTVGSQWQRAIQEDPHLNDAYQALRQSYANELQALGWFGQDLAQELNNIEARHIIHAYRQNVPISDLVTNLAKGRGWHSASENTEENEEAQIEAKKRENSEKLNRLAKAKDASDSLSHAGGASPGSTRISLETIDNMSDQELQGLVTKLRKGGNDGVDKALEKMMGISG